MTRKHFTAIAITLGQQMRRYDERPAECQVIWETAIELARDFRVANPRFDVQRFLEFVRDVAEYRRDLDGKQIKGAA
jgi:hypothetical protein